MKKLLLSLFTGCSLYAQTPTPQVVYVTNTIVVQQPVVVQQPTTVVYQPAPIVVYPRPYYYGYHCYPRPVVSVVAPVFGVEFRVGGYHHFHHHH